jgi:hypothetical protein
MTDYSGKMRWIWQASQPVPYVVMQIVDQRE